MDSEQVSTFKLDVKKEGPLNDRHIAEFSKRPHFDEFYMRGQSLITVGDAKKLALIRSVYNMTIWCEVTRAAVRYLVSRPNLKELILFGLKPSGRLTGFVNAHDLTHFSSLYGLTDSDLLEVAKLPRLQKLGAQQARLTNEALLALLERPLLTDVCFESSNFNDDSAGLVAQSKTITTLELADTNITKTGLESICSMTQLKGLDIWSTHIGESEIDLLARLPNLEYLSIGGPEEQTIFSAKGTLPRLYKIPALKSVWLDGLRVSRDEWEDLNQRYEQVRVAEIVDP